MTDDLDDLKRLLEQATPAPDAAKKAANLALARQNFARLHGTAQETAAQARPTSERPTSGLFRGVKTMLDRLGTRGALAATTAIVALGFVAFVPRIGQSPLPGPTGTNGYTTSESDTRVSDEGAAGRTLRAPAEQAEAAQTPVSPPAAGLPKDAAQANEPASAPAAPAPKRERQTGLADGLTSGIVALEAPQAEIAQPSAQQLAPDRIVVRPDANTEAFAQAEQNPLKITAEEPVSTFSIDVDTASYAILRSSISAGQLPPPEAVRIEELINYFPYDYPAPQAGEAPFRPTVTVTPTPWNDGTELVHIAIQGREAATEDRPPLNLVFLIDTSGSMNQPNKLPLLKQSLALMLPRLSDQDQVAIVAYAGSAGQVLVPTPASERQTILSALENLAAGGSTAGQAGLQQAYAVAEGMAEEGEVTRVILATDGDFNVGLSDPEALKDYIAGKRESGTYLSVMGFGRGNLDDATMQALAQNGNGQASYIDTLSEAQKVLVDQFTGALFPIANDVKIQIEFNPAQVAEYRLIGYETRMLKREDFNNDRVDAGEIGSGHTVTALYEIISPNSASRKVDPLRYGEETPKPKAGVVNGELAWLRIRYKLPGESSSGLTEQPVYAKTRTSFAEAPADARFATAVAGFAQLLRGGGTVGDFTYDDVLKIASDTKGKDPFGYRAEFTQLVRTAAGLTNTAMR